MTLTPGSGGPDDPGSLVERAFWRPHANPKSVWAAVATYPLLILSIYRRDPRLLGASLATVVGSLGAASPPDTDGAWATRVVLGERIWLERGLRSAPGSLGLVAVGAVVHCYAVRAAVKRQPLRTAVGTAASMLLLFVFFDRMVRLYDEYGPLADPGTE